MRKTIAIAVTTLAAAAMFAEPSLAVDTAPCGLECTDTSIELLPGPSVVALVAASIIGAIAIAKLRK